MLPLVSNIWVNWSDGNDKRTKIPEYFEWEQSDDIESFKEMPAVKIEDELLSFIELECEELPKRLLDLIDGLSRTVNPATNRVRKVNYAAVLTNGKRTLAIYTEGTTRPTLKSRLIPKQERRVLDMVKGKEAAEIEWEKPEPEEESIKLQDESLFQYILSVDPKDTVGLTRRERELRELLIEAVFRLGCSENDKEIMYWYVELFPEQYGTKELANMTREDMLRGIFTTVKVGWSDRHFEFGDNLLRYYNDNKELWDGLVNKEEELEKAKE